MAVCSPDQAPKPPSLPLEMALSFMCHGAGTFVSNPLHVVRTRVAAGVWPPTGAFALRRMLALRREGALWAGAVPNTAQLAVSASIRLGMFPAARAAVASVTGWQEQGAATTLTAATGTGIVAGAVIAPLAALKAELHAGAGQHAAPPLPAGASLSARAARAWQAAAVGVRALRTVTARMTRLEVGAMMWRGAVLNCVQITTLAAPTAWALAAARASNGGAEPSLPQALAAYTVAAACSGGACSHSPPCVTASARPSHRSHRRCRLHAH